MVEAGNAPLVGRCPDGCNNDRLLRASIVKNVVVNDGSILAMRLPACLKSLGYPESFVLH